VISKNLQYSSCPAWAARGRIIGRPTGRRHFPVSGGCSSYFGVGPAQRIDSTKEGVRNRLMQRLRGAFFGSKVAF